MEVKLVSYTKPVDELTQSNLNEYIAYVARVSNPANQHNNETADKLIKYLMRNRHWSPLEMADITIEIKCTRDIARQILRHRTFVFQEFSQRYAEVQDYEFSEVRLQDNVNRQNSLETNQQYYHEWWGKAQLEVQQLAQKNYEAALKDGIAKEVARKILPEGLTMSCLYMKGSVRSWIHYLQVRLHKSTQKEHREVALACLNEINKVFNLEGLNENN